MYVMSPTPLQPMIDHQEDAHVRNEPYAFVAYDWHQEDAYA